MARGGWAFAGTTLWAAVMAVGVGAFAPTPLVIAHRGASGYRPEHTIAAYTLAIEMGADVIEPDLVSTKDGVLVARHENEIGGTTDVAEKFPARRTTKRIDNADVTGWFTEDFTLAELKTLRAKERLSFRSHEHDGMFEIPTFDEVMALAAAKSREVGRTIAVYPETKHPTYFRAIGLPLEETLVRQLTARGWTTKSSPVFIQSFEASSLQRLRPMIGARLVQLVSSATDVTPERLKAIAQYADGIGPEKRLVIPVDAAGAAGAPTSLIKDAHAAGLFVHIWTLRREAEFLPKTYGGDLGAEARAFAALGVDGMFTDFPDLVARAIRPGSGPAK